MIDIHEHIYLNKRDSPDLSSDWVYYRITSTGGALGDHIQVCMLKFPSFEDIDIVGEENKAVVTNPGDTGYLSAYPNLCNLLQNKWNVIHADSIVIGFRTRKV